jgi:putative membrane protein
MRAFFALLGLLVLGAIWLGPLPALVSDSFAAHMAVHMGVVAVAAPLFAFSLSGTRYDPSASCPRFFAPIQASVVEFAVIWVWHAPVLHQAARQNSSMFLLEQSTFLASGFWLWMAAAGGAQSARFPRRGAGIAGLLFTSMHMTLLGALFALAPRPLYSHSEMSLHGWSSIADQHLGGVIMLIVGSASYLAGGLWLTFDLIRQRGAAERREPPVDSAPGSSRAEAS